MFQCLFQEIANRTRREKQNHIFLVEGPGYRVLRSNFCEIDELFRYVFTSPALRIDSV